MARMRLDVLLVEQGLFPSREQARTAIMSRRVSVDGQIVDKAGAQVRPEADLQVSGRQLPFVSRGGLKLAKAVQSFGLDFSGLVVAPAPAASPIALCKTARPEFTRLTWAMASWPGNCARTSAWWCWKKPTPVI